MTPSNFTSFPMGSIAQKSEAEQVARNIMIVLKRTGNTWRPLTWEEYRAERMKDGAFASGVHLEKVYFEQVSGYCVSAEQAQRFCADWGQP